MDNTERSIKIASIVDELLNTKEIENPDTVGEILKSLLSEVDFKKYHMEKATEDELISKHAVAMKRTLEKLINRDLIMQEVNFVDIIIKDSLQIYVFTQNPSKMPNLEKLKDCVMQNKAFRCGDMATDFNIALRKIFAGDNQAMKAYEENA